MTLRDDVSICQMLDHAKEAQQLGSGRERKDLDTDRVLQLAMTRLLEIIGEAAGRVSQSTRDHYSQIAWPEIIGLRNRLIHGYDQVDCDIVWRIVLNDVPKLVADLEQIVGEQE